MSPRYYQVKVGNYDVGKEEVHYPIGQEDIHFVPVITGAGRGLGKILLGAALIGLAIINPSVGFWTWTRWSRRWVLLLLLEHLVLQHLQEILV